MLEAIMYIAYAVLALIAIIMARQLRYALKHFTPPHYKTPQSRESDLPSVSVCIPARNEQHALTACLEQVVASTYEKLEIIVLDDVSGDDTSALIQSYAKEGVRFVKGKTLPKGWLGKNHALQGLLEEASGSYILFMDVDTRLEPQAIEYMVRYALSKNLSMVSVLPRREDGWRASIVLSPLRYFWEIMFHRRHSPATASNAWLIRRNVLTHRFLGFTTFKNAVQPETNIAAELADTGEYHFLISTPAFGVTYEKKWRSQLVTSVRLLFPLLRSEVAFALIALLDLFILLIPTLALVSLFFTPFEGIHVGAIIMVIIYSVLYGSYTRRVWHRGWWLGGVLWPLLVLQEMVLIIASIFQYKRRTVRWKGRFIQPEAQN